MSQIRKLSTIVSLALATVSIAASVAAAQSTTPVYKRDLPEKLTKQARVTEDSAAKIAQAKLPGATIEAVELENEHGKLQYSYDMKLAGKTGIEEVNVDAMTGKVIALEHESAAMVRKEAAAEKAESKKKP